MTKRGRYSPDNLIRSEDLPFTPGEVVRLPERLSDPNEIESWREKLRDPDQPKVIDLFCGAGGMSEGFASAGFTVAAAFDHDPMAVSTFAANLPGRVVCTDIDAIQDPASMLTDLEALGVSGIDVIIGGPPCQGFSQVGKARIRSLAEEEQARLLARNEMFQHYFRFVEAMRPAMFVMENVPTLATFENGAYMQAIKRECQRLDYDMDYEIIDSADYGVPQTRRRLIIVGSRMGMLFTWPRKVHQQDRVVLGDAIGDLPAVKPPSLMERLPYRPQEPLSVYQRLMRSRVKPEDRDGIYDHVVRPVRKDDIEIFRHMTPGDRYIDIDERYRRYNSESFKDKYYMLRPDAPGVTITAHLAKDGYRYIHWDPEQHRTISVREAARIQSFGDHYRFAGSRSARYKHIGNAVPPLMAQRIAEQVLRALRRGSGWLPGDMIQPGLPGMERQTQLITLFE
jgi:DNA (cytosine-5)-methyltransferase 1